MQRRFLLLILGLIAVACGASAAHGAEAETGALPGSAPHRPKIGLVLSGGGARGFAHIGVLRELERRRVPVDIVVGTSMGSIIGGLYAMGLSPDEIETGVEGIDWVHVFDDYAQRRHRMYRRKHDEYDFYSMHRLGIKDRSVQVAPGLIEGQAIETALDRLTYPAFHIRDFDRLQRPYRAIGTDIATGEAVVIGEGNIAKAMRASMSIPGALPPVQYGGKLLVDGGIGNNVPIDVARELGADIVIVVDVSAPLLKTEEISSSIDITGQLTTILTRRRAEQQIATMGDRDVLIIPQRYDLSSSDFVFYPQLIEEGERAAQVEAESIAALSLDEAGYAEHLAGMAPNLLKNPVIDFIEIRNSTPLADGVFTRLVRQQTGETLDVAQLEEDLAIIYGLDLSSSVVYTIERQDGRTGLVIYVRYRDWAPTYMMLGLSLETQFESGSNTNISASFTHPTLNELGGEFRATVQAGSEPGASMELHQPLDLNLSWFVSGKVGFHSLNYPKIDSDDLEAIFQQRRQALSLSAGKVFGTSTVLSLSWFRTNGTSDTVTGTADPLIEVFDEGGIELLLNRDTLNNISFPNDGSSITLGYRANRESLGADADYDQMMVRLSGATTWQRMTLLGRVVMETTPDENAPDNALFRRGGFMELSGTYRNALAGQHFGLGQVAAYRRLGNVSFLPMYAGFSLETGNAWDSKDDITRENMLFAGSLFVGADTFLGPMYFAMGRTNKGDSAAYLYIGRHIGLF